MLRTHADQVSLWEAVLPEEVRRLSVELQRVDGLLDDEVFFAPFRPFFDPRFGRPSTPMETYLRLMFLKSRHGVPVVSGTKTTTTNRPCLGSMSASHGQWGGAPPDCQTNNHPSRRGRDRSLVAGL
jgi:IS5 family transposase